MRTELERLEVPEGTTVEEHDLVTDGDVFVGGQSTVEFGVRGRTVVAGERVRFGGDIEAGEDCRLDMWCDVAGNVLVGRDAYIGERVHVGGQLMVSGDLDIGDDVEVDEGLEANGWIVIRNPMPTIVFLFVYLTQLLRLGEEEEAERLLGEVVGADDQGTDPLVVPRGATLGDDAWQVSTPATIGAHCRLHGNVRAESITVGTGTEVFGSLRAREEVTVGPGTVVHGDVTSRSGNATVAADVTIKGDIGCADLDLHEEADVEGTIRADGEVTIRSEPRAAPDLGAVENGETSALTAGDGAGWSGGADGPVPAITAIDADAWIDRSVLAGGDGQSVQVPGESPEAVGGGEAAE